MDAAHGQALRRSAPPNIMVEPEALLRHADDPMAFGSSMTLLPGIGVDITLRVVGSGGRPLPKATVSVFGQGFPAQGQTDDKGEVTVTLFSGPIETVQAVYVKPVADSWDRMIQNPGLQSGGVKTLELRRPSGCVSAVPAPGRACWRQ